MIHDGGGGLAGQLYQISEKKERKKKTLRKCIFRAGHFAALSLFRLVKRLFFVGKGYFFTHFTNFIQRLQK